MGKGNNKKFEIVFDPQKRKDFLTGFKKRKDQRRRKAQDEIRKEERKAKAEFRQEKKKKIEEIN